MLHPCFHPNPPVRRLLGRNSPETRSGRRQGNGIAETGVVVDPCSATLARKGACPLRSLVRLNLKVAGALDIA